MAILIQTSDFTGKYSIAQNSFTPLQSYINKYEKEYLVDLLGVELYDLFAADVTSYAPVTPIYQSIYNPFKQDYNKCIVYSVGMKEMLLGFIYFEYMRDQKIKNTITGAVVNANENARESGFSEFNLFSKYNEGIHTYEAIQWFINENKTDYPTYNGKCKKLMYWI